MGNGVPIYAVVFDGKLPKGWRRAAASLQNSSATVSGVPNKATKAGKLIKGEVDALPFKPSPYIVTNKINYPMGISYKKGDVRGSATVGGFFGPSIAWLGDIFYLGLGNFAKSKKRYEDDGYTVTTPDWELLPGMVEVLKERVDLDFAEAALREAA